MLAAGSARPDSHEPISVLTDCSLFRWTAPCSRHCTHRATCSTWVAASSAWGGACSHEPLSVLTDLMNCSLFSRTVLCSHGPLFVPGTVLIGRAALRRRAFPAPGGARALMNRSLFSRISRPALSSHGPLPVLMDRSLFQALHSSEQFLYVEGRFRRLGGRVPSGLAVFDFHPSCS